MKFAWFTVTCLLAIHAAEAFRDLFKPHPDDKPSLLGILTKPKIPGVNIQLGSHLGHGSFGFSFGLGGHRTPGNGGYSPPKENANVKPVYPGNPWDEKNEKVGPRPNWGDGKDEYPKPGSHDYDTEDYPKPGSHDYDKEDYPMPGSHDYDKEDYPKPGSYEDDADYSRPGSYGDDKDDYPNPGSLKDNKDYPKEKDSLPDWGDIGEKIPKSESLMDGDLVGDGLIQPRLNRRRSKRFIESRIFHVPLVFRSNGKPYQVKIRSNPNSLSKGKAKS